MYQFNSSISVDCVIFGFDGKSLKTLLINRDKENIDNEFKLPGDMIFEHENLDQAAYRILENYAGISDLYQIGRAHV